MISSNAAVPKGLMNAMRRCAASVATYQTLPAEDPARLARSARNGLMSMIGIPAADEVCHEPPVVGLAPLPKT